MKIIQDHMASKQEYEAKEKLVSFSPVRFLKANLLNFVGGCVCVIIKVHA